MKLACVTPTIRGLDAGGVNPFRHGHTNACPQIDGVSVASLVAEFGSPLFVFSEATLRQKYREAQRAFARRYPDVQFAWSYKTNYLNAICQVFHQEGSIAEVVSEFEYEKARHNGIPGRNIIFNGPHKSRASLERAVSVAEGRRVARGEFLGHCGNSGRSPVPHLHLHAQETAALGASTRPFCLAHFLSRADGDDVWTYQTANVPAHDETITPCVFDPAIFSTLSGWLPGEYRWRVTAEDRGTWEETLLMDFDETGCFRVRSRRYDAGFRAFLRDGVFFCVEFEGPGKSVAALLALGLSRVPCIVVPENGVLWRDHFSSVPFAPRWSHWMHETLDPFIGPSLLAYRYRFDGDGTICSDLTDDATAPGVPRSVKITLAPRQLATSLEARFTNDRTLRAELVHYVVQSARA